MGRLKERLPAFRGTSNYMLAQKYKLPAVGTQAHEWFQAHQQLGFPLEHSQRAALTSWLDEFTDHLGIALTDCITMDAFLRDFDFELASSYQGLRHDSGDPVVWGEKAISHYQRLGIDPTDKTLVFSDGLNLDKGGAAVPSLPWPHQHQFRHRHQAHLRSARCQPDEHRLQADRVQWRPGCQDLR